MAFNVDQLLNTNSTPTQAQRNNLQNFILQLDEAILNTDEDITGINEQILAMQAKILVLQTRRAQLVQQRRSYSSLLSPVRCLPIEIFGLIFFYATRDRPRHVLNISAVCRLWRAAALSTPMLWSTLELGHHMTIRNIDNHINSWIERARSYPLSLVIQIRKRENSRDPVDSVLRLALITKHRWKSIALDSYGTIISPILKELEFSNLEMLESFSLATHFYDFPRALDALRYAPKLKTLSFKLNTEDHNVVFDTLPFPWRQLTSLTIMFFGENDNSIYKDILQACVNLEEFIIGGNDFNASESNDSETVTVSLSNLRKLHTHCDHHMFLTILETPSILDFAIKASDSQILDFHSTGIVYGYIKKNGSTLLKLSIAPVTVHFEIVLSVPYLRSLVELKLYDADASGSFNMYQILMSLVVDPEMGPSTIPLPRLEALEIICQATEQNQRVFMKVIKSRWWSDEEDTARQKQGQRSLSRIKRSVFLNVHTEMNTFCRDDVDVLRAEGMSIEYLYPFDGMDNDDFYTSCYYS